MPATHRAARGDGVGKRFGGVQALADVSFTISRGEIYGLIGPNGAGKTTLFNVLTGIYPPDGGEFVFDGQPLAGLKPHEVAARGIARTFQNIRLFANLSALENVMIGRHVRTHAGVLGRDPAQPRARAPRRSGDRGARAASCSSTSASPARANDLAQAPALRRPAPAGDRARAGHRARSCSRSTSRRRA